MAKNLHPLVGKYNDFNTLIISLLMFNFIDTVFQTSNKVLYGNPVIPKVPIDTEKYFLTRDIENIIFPQEFRLFLDWVPENFGIDLGNISDTFINRISINCMNYLNDLSCLDLRGFPTQEIYFENINADVFNNLGTNYQQTTFLTFLLKREYLEGKVFSLRGLLAWLKKASKYDLTYTNLTLVILPLLVACGIVTKIEHGKYKVSSKEKVVNAFLALTNYKYIQKMKNCEMLELDKETEKKFTLAFKLIFRDKWKSVYKLFNYKLYYQSYAGLRDYEEKQMEKAQPFKTCYGPGSIKVFTPKISIDKSIKECVHITINLPPEYMGKEKKIFVNHIT